MSSPAAPSSSNADALSLELTQLLVQTTELEDFLLEATQLATRLVDTRASCAITMRIGDEVRTVASSDPDAAQYDEIQYGRGQGPCLQAMHTGQMVAVPDLGADDRWPDYRMNAIAYGQRSSLSAPLRRDGTLIGALNLYSEQTHTFDGIHAHLLAFAAHLSSALGVMLRQVDQAIISDQMREALTSRAVIDQALGIVMGQRRCPASEALDLLRTVSQTRNLKLRDVAADIIRTTTGQEPSQTAPFIDRR